MHLRKPLTRHTPPLKGFLFLSGNREGCPLHTLLVGILFAPVCPSKGKGKEVFLCIEGTEVIKSTTCIRRRC